MEGVVYVKGEEPWAERVKIFDNPEKAIPVFHRETLRMLRLLSQKPMYVSELRKRTGLSDQKTYYHLKKLLRAGLIEITNTKAVRGTLAKEYAAQTPNLCIMIKKEKRKVSEAFAERKSKAIEFFSEMVSLNQFRGRIVVGSSDPHGPLKARARDSHYAIELAFFLGRTLELPPEFLVSLDVEEKEPQGNIVVVGGPVTNMAYDWLNPHLPVRFTTTKPYEIYSSKTGKSYTEEHIGVICKVPNPRNREKAAVTFAGITKEGTRAAVIALTRFSKTTLKDYRGTPWSRVVEGFDLDGDGIIDSVEVIE